MKRETCGALFGAGLVMIGYGVINLISDLKKENKELKAENKKYSIAMDIYEMANKSLSRELDEKDELLKQIESK